MIQIILKFALIGIRPAIISHRWKTLPDLGIGDKNQKTSAEKNANQRLLNVEFEIRDMEI